jgi:hypothetical protein
MFRICTQFSLNITVEVNSYNWKRVESDVIMQIFPTITEQKPNIQCIIHLNTQRSADVQFLLYKNFSK